jgi:5-formyltetrahydrofolate cyclo-ligase
VYSGEIDLIIIPAVAFSTVCTRLGHGKGYYDCFIERVTKSRNEQGKAKPFLVGVALDEQIVEDIPVEAHDV